MADVEHLQDFRKYEGNRLKFLRLDNQSACQTALLGNNRHSLAGSATQSRFADAIRVLESQMMSHHPDRKAFQRSAERKPADLVDNVSPYTSDLDSPRIMNHSSV